MGATIVTFIGGEECGDIGKTTMGHAATHEVVFPLGRPVEIDPDSEANPIKRKVLENIVRKAKGNRFFVVESEDAPAPVLVEGAPLVRRRGPNRPKIVTPAPEAA